MISINCSNSIAKCHLVIVGIFTVVVTVVLVKLVSLVTPLRVSEEDEYTGLDLAAHGERA
ncbi:hypothetical protein, partial [Klebsiella pneumoniae]|uniref:hypothetical protein n=1 Tax=Klebsiella pneumoniae TaxID=573 RepID=UPI003C6D0DCB